ncbi:FxSxx-COOH system tetratricopeptide repeat protein [Microcystis aeruginosa]|uniref:FxSxx-COOH system tetratricopeptide repeat protein n=1 Tax=Microcystis aeruginosa TaxID=1126 RepID=UPI002330FD29|nr:FxSxx-COOH system tetratricopeptide repeat protein [Microcystis aeruginosa]
MDNKISQTAFQNVTVGNDAKLNVHQTINLPKISRTIPSDVRQGTPNFVGRQQDLTNLHEALQNEGKVSVYAVRGMGGVGKTELAVQYALSREFQQRYVACYWFSLNQGNLATQILLKATPYLAMPEELQKSGSVEEQVKWCWQNWHPQEGQILIVIDDVKSLEDIPQELLPISSRFKVMLTTRQRNLSPSFWELSLGVLSEAESIELLTKIVDAELTSRIENEMETAKEICRYLGYLPLALELVAKYLKDDEMLSLEDYLQQLSLEDESLSNEMVRGITAERGVIAAFNLSWQRLQGLATQLAMLLGRFAAAAIPWQDLVEPTINSLGWEKKAVKDARKHLTHLSLIEIENGKNIVIHALLREYFRYQSKQEGDDFIHVLQGGIASSGIAVVKTISDTPVIADIERVRLAIPHLELLSQEMLDDIPNPDEDLILVFVGVALFHNGQGQYNLAERYLDNCLEAAQSRLGDNHLSVAISLNNLASLYNFQGRYEKAKLLLIQALELHKRLLGDNHPHIAASLNGLAYSYYSQGRYEEAESLLIQALELHKRLLEDNHPNVATSLCNLANLYNAQGKYEEAEPFFLQALELDKRLFGDNNPNVATSLNGLAYLYNAQGKYEEAEPLLIQALELHKRLLGDNHPDVATSLNGLAHVYYSQGRYEEAEYFYLQALELRQRILGENHPDVATSLSGLAGLYNFQGRYEEAEYFYLQALELRKQLLGDNHPYVAISLNDLASFHELQGKYEEAEPLFLQALELRKRLLGENHPYVATSLMSLAGLYESQRRYEEAEPLHLQALELYKRLLGENHPDVADSLNNLAELYRSQGRYEEAEPLNLQALELYKRLFGENHPCVATSLNNLALIYSSQGKYAESESIHLQVLELRQRRLGENHPSVSNSLKNLAGLYDSQGRYEEAEPLYLQALELDKRLLGENHPHVASCLNNLALLYNTQGKYAEAEVFSQQALVIYRQTLESQYPDTEDALLARRMFHIQILLHCDTQTLFSILQALAQQAELPAFNTEAMLMILKVLESNTELLSYVREVLQSHAVDNEYPSTTTTRKNLQIRRQQQHSTSLNWWQLIIVILLTPFSWVFRLIRWLVRRFIR